MVLKDFVIIPFQCKQVQKLLAIKASNRRGPITFYDIKQTVCSQFELNDCVFYNKKIGFQIPNDLLIPYLEQRRDLTNFVIEITEVGLVEEAGAEQIESESKECIPDEPTLTIKTRAYRNGLDNEMTVVKKRRRSTDSPDIDAHLNDILKTSEGQTVWNNFQSTGLLTDNDRQHFTNLLIIYELKKLTITDYEPLSIDKRRYQDLAEAIANKFPGEQAEDYYIPPSKTLKRIAGGKLYDQFCAAKCRYLSMEACNRYTVSPEAVHTDFLELDDLLEISDFWWPYFKAWRKTFDLRMEYVRISGQPLDYFDKFIANQQSNAVKLVEHDFEQLHPGKTHKLIDTWDLMSERIFTEAIACRDQCVPLILDMYGSAPELSEFMMFSYLLKIRERDMSAFFKADDPGNLIAHLRSEKPLDVLKELCRRCKQPPKVFALGQTAPDLIFYAVVGDNLFKMESAIKAVDFCFKCYRTMRLPFPDTQNLAWQVIQNVMYDLKTDEDYTVSEQILNIFKSP